MLIYVSVYLAIIEKYKSSLLVMLPAFLVYFMVAAFQYDVGTDYFSYVDIFEDENRHWFYFNKGEYLFFGLNQFLNWFSLPPQSIFISISFIQATLFFFYLKLVKNKGFTVWLFFVVFFLVTNIYNNQLNGLRQYVVISGLPLFTILLYERKLLKSLALLILFSFFHNTAWLLAVLYPAILIQKKLNISLVFLFFVSGVGYLFLSGFMYDLTAFIFPDYLHYFEGRYSEPYPVSVFLSKLYYLPLILYFFVIYRKGNADVDDYVHSMLFVFSAVYWFFLLALSVGITARIYYYFIFFYIFPVYYTLHYNYVRKRVVEFILILAYIVLPYVLKVTVFAKAEFLYESVLWN